MIASIVLVVASPTRLSTSTAITGPMTTSTRGRHASASRPNPTCDTDAAIWNSIVKVPAAASESPRRGISSGSNGA